MKNTQEWISCKDSLPNVGDFILATGPGLGGHVDGPEIDICIWDGSHVWDEGGTELTGCKFTHWMPLPDVPK